MLLDKSRSHTANELPLHKLWFPIHEKELGYVRQLCYTKLSFADLVQIAEETKERYGKPPNLAWVLKSAERRDK